MSQSTNKVVQETWCAAMVITHNTDRKGTSSSIYACSLGMGMQTQPIRVAWFSASKKLLPRYSELLNIDY